MTSLPKYLQARCDAEALKEHIYEPKYGGKDHSGYDTLMKYEVNYEREDAFCRGFESCHSVYLERANATWDEAKVLNEIKRLKDYKAEYLKIQLERKVQDLRIQSDEVVIDQQHKIIEVKDARITELEAQLGVAVEVLEFAITRDRSRGYPTGTEYLDIIEKIREGLASLKGEKK